jgi:hypothetical protein
MSWLSVAEPQVLEDEGLHLHNINTPADLVTLK